VSVVYLGLGSNLGNREQMLRLALEELGAFVRLERLSDLYETEPVGLVEQPWFLNAVCSGETDLSPLDLLRACKMLETALGRQPGPRFGPRLIDIDVLAYDALVMATAELTLPHPALHERGFVLGPLVDIAPDWRHPLLGRSVREMYGAGRFSTVRRVGWAPPGPTFVTAAQEGATAKP